MLEIELLQNLIGKLYLKNSIKRGREKEFFKELVEPLYKDFLRVHEQYYELAILIEEECGCLRSYINAQYGIEQPKDAENSFNIKEDTDWNKLADIVFQFQSVDRMLVSAEANRRDVIDFRIQFSEIESIVSPRSSEKFDDFFKSVVDYIWRARESRVMSYSARDVFIKSVTREVSDLSIFTKEGSSYIEEATDIIMRLSSGYRKKLIRNFELAKTAYIQLKAEIYSIK